MNHQPNIVHLAVEAAGGPDAVSSSLKLGRATPSAWKRRGIIPSRYIAHIVDMGKGVISEKQLTDYIAEVGGKRLQEKKEERARLKQANQ